MLTELSSRDVHMYGWLGLLEVSVVRVRAHPLLAGRVLHALAHQVVAHVADALQRIREVRADLREGIREEMR